MKKIFLFASMVLFCLPSLATPPGDLNLTYDLDKGTLTAQGPHPTQDLTEHYIRRLEVIKNDEAPQMFYFPRQSSAAEFRETVPLDIKPGDRLHVQVFCSQGGTKAADLVIPEAPAPTEEIDLKALKDKDHNTTPVIP